MSFDPKHLPALASRRQMARIVEALGDKIAVGRSFAVEIRFDHHDIKVRDLMAFLSLLDGAYGRTFPRGIYSYAHRPAAQLRIARVGKGSSTFEILFELLQNLDLWQMLIVYLVAKTGPAILKGEAPRNWAEAAKAAGEAMSVWSQIGEDKRQRRVEERRRLPRRQRNFIRDVIANDEITGEIGERERRALQDAVEEILEAEWQNLRGASSFSARHVLEIALRELGRLTDDGKAD